MSTNCKFYKEEEYVSYDSGETWTAMGVYRKGDLIEYDSEDCGYVPEPQYRTLSTATTCVGVDKYTLEEYQVSYDGGVTWETTGTSATTLIEAYSEDCGYVPMQRTTSGTPYCSGASGYDKYVDVYSQVSYDSGSTWVTTATTPTLVEADSEDCGYVPPTPTGNTKFSASYGGETYSVDCDSDTTLTTATTRPRGYQPSGMTNAVIGDCINSIGERAFYFDKNGINQFGVSFTSVTIPNSVTTIGSASFSGCTSLSSVTIPSGVTNIGDSAFAYCTSLTSVTIPDSVTSIGWWAFMYCNGIRSLTIGSGITSIGFRNFQGCSNLPNIIIPDSVTSIGDGAFSNCTSLTSCTIGSSVTNIDSGAFNMCSSLTSIDIPSGVTNIGDMAFHNCTSLTSVTIPDSVTTITEFVFDGCSGLPSIIIPNSVTIIGRYAFRNCSGLTSVTIPSSVTSIGENAFYFCTSLTSVTVEAIKPPTIKYYVFDNTNNCPIYVPSASVNAYKSATNWSTYASRIQAIP